MEKENIYLEVKDIVKTYANVTASDHVSFQIPKGELIGLLGPSGSGKTTILRILAGLEDADAGEIYIGGKPVDHVKASKRGIGFVFQNYALFRYKTVEENIAFGLKVAKWKTAAIRKRVAELIELVGLAGMEKRYPNQLSGGQRQRVAFARALATEPRLLLLDEPFAALDAKVRKELRTWLKQLIKKVGITSIFVTHDQNEAIEVADQIIVMNHGKIEQIGSPFAVYSSPDTAFVAQFLGTSSYVEDFTKFKGYEAYHPKKGTGAVIRSEYVTVSKKSEPVKYPVTTETGVVESVSFRGDMLELQVNVKGELLTAFRPFTDAIVREKEQVNVWIQRLYLVDDEQTVAAENHEAEADARLHLLQNPVLEQDVSMVI